jgi:hypothetical protein
VQIQVELNEALIIQLLIELNLLECDLPEIKEKLQAELAKTIEYMLITNHEEVMKDFYAKEFFQLVHFITLKGGRSDDPEVQAAFLNSEFSLLGKAKNLVREIWSSKCRRQKKPNPPIR